MKSSARYLTVILSIGLLAAASLLFPGCKAQQQMQQQIADMDAKLADSQRRITALDGDLKKENYELTQLKALVTKLGNVTVDLQRAEEERQKAVADAKARMAAAASSKKRPAAPAKAAPKKKHK